MTLLETSHGNFTIALNSRKKRRVGVRKLPEMTSTTNYLGRRHDFSRDHRPNFMIQGGGNATYFASKEPSRRSRN